LQHFDKNGDDKISFAESFLPVQLAGQLAVQLAGQLAGQLAWDARRKTSRKAAENSLRKLRQNQGTVEPHTVVTWKSPLTRKGERR
jgi:hypothetical protein